MNNKASIEQCFTDTVKHARVSSTGMASTRGRSRRRSCHGSRGGGEEEVITVQRMCGHRVVTVTIVALTHVLLLVVETIHLLGVIIRVFTNMLDLGTFIFGVAVINVTTG